MARKLFNQSGRRKKIARSTGAPCKPWARFLTTTSNYTIPTAAVAFPNLFGRGFFIARTIWNVDTAEPWWYSRKDRAERCIPDCLHWPRLRHKLSQQFQRAMESNGLMPGSTAVFAQAGRQRLGSRDQLSRRIVFFGDRVVRSSRQQTAAAKRRSDGYFEILLRAACAILRSGARKVMV